MTRDWRRGRTAGAVKQQGDLLMSDGNRALAVDPKGSTRLSWEGDSRLLSAPTLVAPNVLLVADADRVMQLIAPPGGG